MEDLIQASRIVFDALPQPFGIARIFVNDAGLPTDFGYEYVNPALAELTGVSVEELTGKLSSDLWVGLQSRWMEPFVRAAFHGETMEFEAVAADVRHFLHATIFPLRPSYCGFIIQDVTSWYGRAYFSRDNTLAGLFFYDEETGMMMLTPPASQYCGFSEAYLEISDFVEQLLGPQSVAAFAEKLVTFASDDSPLVHEGQLADGRWLRMSLAHAQEAERFALGLLEDVTHQKALEHTAARHLDIIDSLSYENFALYLIDLEADTMEPYRIRQAPPGPLAAVTGGTTSFSQFVDLYTESYIGAADRERFRTEMRREGLIEQLKEGAGEFSMSLRRAYEKEEEFIELRFIPLPHAANELVMAARNTTREVREQMLQKAALQNALDLAEHASEAKSTFLTNMSHDFRTPLNSITGFAGIALRHLDDPARVHDRMNKIMLSSKHLLNLVDDILDVSRVESGKMSINEELLDLRELLDSIQTMFSSQAADGHISFKVMEEGLVHPFVLADRLRLNQILVNIIGNSFKFTEAGGSIVFLLSEAPHRAKDHGSYTFAVTDSGCGMTEEFIEKLFVPFERDGLGRPNTTEGTGLGMTITKNLVDLMGGTIEVHSKVGEGTAIMVSLSLRSQVDRAVGDDPVEGRPHHGEVSFDGRRVLVVDDDELSREIMMELLREHGFMVEEADDGDVAVARVAEVPEGHYDAVIMDMRMRRMNGDEAARAMRALDRADIESMPIIAVTADAFDEARHRSHEAGMTAHTTKPLNVPELLSILVEHLPIAR